MKRNDSYKAEAAFPPLLLSLFILISGLCLVKEWLLNKAKRGYRLIRRSIFNVIISTRCFLVFNDTEFQCQALNRQDLEGVQENRDKCPPKHHV